MTPQVEAWIGANWWKLGLLVVLAASAMGALERKADTKDVERVERKVDVIVTVVCTDPPPPAKLACATLPRP